MVERIEGSSEFEQHAKDVRQVEFLAYQAALLSYEGNLRETPADTYHPLPPLPPKGLQDSLFVIAQSQEYISKQWRGGNEINGVPTRRDLYRELWYMLERHKELLARVCGVKKRTDPVQGFLHTERSLSAFEQIEEHITDFGAHHYGHKGDLYGDLCKAIEAIDPGAHITINGKTHTMWVRTDYILLAIGYIGGGYVLAANAKLELPEGLQKLSYKTLMTEFAVRHEEWTKQVEGGFALERFLTE